MTHLVAVAVIRRRVRPTIFFIKRSCLNTTEAVATLETPLKSGTSAALVSAVDFFRSVRFRVAANSNCSASYCLASLFFAHAFFLQYGLCLAFCFGFGLCLCLCLCLGLSCFLSFLFSSAFMLSSSFRSLRQWFWLVFMNWLAPEGKSGMLCCLWEGEISTY